MTLRGAWSVGTLLYGAPQSIKAETGGFGMGGASNGPQAATPGAAAVQVKLSLRGASKPPVWRRLLIPAAMRLDQFHVVIQAAMGWTDSHMHAFSTDSGDYGIPDPELEFRDERKARLEQFLGAPGDRIRYTYDFGDDWDHDIVVEEVLHPEPGARIPVCLAGKGTCPPEDCGGVWGYADLREALANSAHDDHDAMLEWLGLESVADFDPAAFDIAEANDALDVIALPRR